MIPIHAEIKNAESFGYRKKRLGDSKKWTCLTNKGTGRSPRSLRRGLNWLSATTKAIKYARPRPLWKTNRVSQKSPEAFTPRYYFTRIRKSNSVKCSLD